MQNGGRQPKPTILKDLHGSTEPRNPYEPVAEGELGIDDCPEHFTADQRVLWEFVLTHAPRTLLKQIDGHTVEQYVVAISTHRKATIKQNAMGDELVTFTESGYPVLSPYLAIQNKQALLSSKLAEELGFTPGSRPKMIAGAVHALATVTGKPGPKPKHGTPNPTKSIEEYLRTAPRFTSAH
jgi:P27 family predicted phage terminase small subunit